MPGRLRIAEGDLRAEQIRVSNPLSIEHSELRTMMLGSLLGAARHNVARGAERVALYESGRAYLREGSSPFDGVLGGSFAGDRPSPVHEPQRIACLATGALRPGGWGGQPVESDFFAIKAVLEALASQLGTEVDVGPGEEPFLHPGRSGQILLGGNDAGWIGEVHPLVCRAWDLEAAAGFELELAGLASLSPSGQERFEDVISYPAVNQDLAVVVPEETSAAAVREAVLAGGGELLRSAEVFDLYRGEQLGEGRKSLALRLSFRASDRTLTDEEVAPLRESIREALAAIGGSLRE
jgi:phenylalanyl-tRNA synthetase beta chain